MFNYEFKVNVGEFHLIYFSLGEKIISNEKEMESLVKVPSPYADDFFENSDIVITNPERYERLKKENQELQALKDRLYKESDEQLGK